DEGHLATGSLDGTLTIWDMATGQEVGTYRGHERDVRELVYSPDGKRALALGSDRVLRSWDATRGPDYHPLKCRGAWHAVFSADGRRIAAAACQPIGGLWGITVWDAQTRKVLRGLAARTHVARAVAFNPGGSQVAVAVSIGSNQGAVKVFDVAAGKLIRNL